ncbi:MAG: cytochrome c oxidase subunit II [Gemmatimonadaceae bacterium]
MPADPRPRRLSTVALTVALALLSGCVQNPNSVFHSRTDFNRDVGSLFALLIWLGVIVFVFTEGMLLYAMWKYRSRPGTAHVPKQVHGNTKLEILWTVIPAVVLAIIAVPTVQTIFKTQDEARGDALQIEVVGHQWWWEFRYPQYNVSTANEVYLPIGRTANFALRTHDVVHSFWIPGLGGKRDLVNNRTNYIWFTPDSVGEEAFNGFCAEYCGTSHANMRFKAFTVTAEQFASWITHQQQPAAFVLPAPGARGAPGAPGARGAPAAAQSPRGTTAARATTTAAAPAAATQAPQPVQAVQAVQGGFLAFPSEKMPDYAVPHTPLPAGLSFDTTLVGDVARGAQLVAYGTCIGCHTVRGAPTAIGTIGPDLTHVGSRLTIAGGLYPNDKTHLGAWIKNARAMKPGSFMNTLGIGQYDPIVKSTIKIGLTDQQVADIVAYLQALK